MKHLAPFYRIAVVISGILGISLLLSACNASPSAATVNGHVITVSKVNSYLSETVNSSYAQCELDLRLGGTLPVLGTGHQTVSPDLSAEILTSLIEQEIIDDYLSGRGIKITSSEVSSAESDLSAELTATSTSTGPTGVPSGSPCGISGSQLLGKLPAQYLNQQVALQAALEKFIEVAGHFSASTAEAKSFYNKNPQDFAVVCLNAIEVPSQAQATAISQQIAKGVSFSSLASKYAPNPSVAASGGSIGCISTSNIPPQISSAIGTLPSGGVTQPLQQTSPGAAPVWVILQVASRSETPFNQVESSIRLQLISNHSQVLSTKLPLVLKVAHVSVNPMYGSWSAKGGITPPKAPSSRYSKN